MLLYLLMHQDILHSPFSFFFLLRFIPEKLTRLFNGIASTIFKLFEFSQVTKCVLLSSLMTMMSLKNAKDYWVNEIDNFHCVFPMFVHTCMYIYIYYIYIIIYSWLWIIYIWFSYMEQWNFLVWLLKLDYFLRIFNDSHKNKILQSKNL
jgi:hypothetical protein